MRLLCPFCQKAITVADSEAGKAVNCPECNQQFAAPQLFTPSPSVEPQVEKTSFPVPPAVPETYTPEPKLDAPPPRLPDLPLPDRELSGFAKMVSFPIEPRVVRFIPAAALFVVFVLTFFSWNGLFPGGHSAFTQNAWYGAVASMSRDVVAEDELKLMGDELYNRLRTSWFLVPFLILMFPALALAFGGLLVEILKVKIPPNLQSIWRFRPALLGLFALMMLLFVLAQWGSGFGLQKAVSEKIEERNAEKKAQANTPEKLQRVEMTVAMDKESFPARTTIWLRFAILANLIAVLAAATETCLMLRGNKPPPRVGFMW